MVDTAQSPQEDFPIPAPAVPQTDPAVLDVMQAMTRELTALREEVQAVKQAANPTVELFPVPDLEKMTPLDRSIYALVSHVPADSTAVVTISAAMWRDLLSVVAAMQAEIVALQSPPE